jgi:hypothetical protein
MTTITELTNRVISPTRRPQREPKREVLTERIRPGSRIARSSTYEIEVFNHFWGCREDLSIRQIVRFRNRLLEGEITLSDGRRLLLEIKLRMGWLKACQAEYQVRSYLRRYNADNKPVDGAIVVFEEFSGDWNKKKGEAKNLWGWEAWYLHHAYGIDGIRMDLLRLRNGELTGYPP